MFEGSKTPASPGVGRLIFVTGCYRSGTTLVEKLLHSHPNLSLASQPFPVLYFATKAKFLENLGLERRYPLGHLFLEEDYTPGQFGSFLENHRFDEADLSRFWEEMDRYTEGLWTPEILRYRDKLPAGTFWELYRRLMGFVPSLFPKDDLSYIGSKEILCEEFVPFLLHKGVKVLLVLRDPRAMICSLDFADRDNKTGLDRPILYSLRIWRKSVATALGWKDHPGLMFVRYEDVVRRTTEVMAQVTDFLGIPPYPSRVFSEEIRDQRGEPWRGNSSFEDKEGVVSQSSSTFEDRLNEQVLGFVETVALPEMKALGYEPRVIDWFHEENLKNFRGPFERIHPRFPADYSHDPSRISAEVERFRKLVAKEELGDETQARIWFLNRRAYRSMRAALLTGTPGHGFRVEGVSR